MHLSLPCKRHWSYFGLALAVFAAGLLFLFGPGARSDALAETVTCTPNNTSCTAYPDFDGEDLSISVTLGGAVLETSLQLKGFAAPGAFVLVADGTDIVGAGTAQSDGAFDFTIHALSPGSTHSVSVYAANSTQVTPSVSFVVTVSTGTSILVENILLPTFIDVVPLTQNVGDPVHVQGTTVPGGDVTVFIASPSQSTTIAANAVTGAWDVELIGEFGILPASVYQAHAIVNYSSFISPDSRTVPFEIKEIPSSTKLVVNGYGAPGAFLSFKNGTAVIGSGLVAANGTFSATITFPDVSMPIDLNIVADDGSQITPPTNISTSITAFDTTTIDDVIMPPFIDVTPVAANEGAPITADGSGAPGADLFLTIMNPIQNTTTTLDVSGNWEVELLSVFGNLPEGVYTAYAHIELPGGLVSVNSRSVTFQVTEVTTSTSLVVSGFAAPNAFLTFTENNSVVGTAIAGVNGTFSQTLQFPDVTLTRTISMVADNGVQQTPATVFTATLTALSQTTVDNLVAPTFIDVTPLQVPYGSTVTALGTTFPNSMVRLFVQSPLVSADLTSEVANGQWSGDLNALFGQLQKGTYTAYARVYVPGGYQSNLSREITFEVVDADQCADRRSDLNCDGKVDITDVGILIYYWGAAGAGQKADIDHNGVVDVSDVGIMVYDWTY